MFLLIQLFASLTLGPFTGISSSSSARGNKSTVIIIIIILQTNIIVAFYCKLLLTSTADFFKSLNLSQMTTMWKVEYKAVTVYNIAIVKNN